MPNFRRIDIWESASSSKPLVLGTGFLCTSGGALSFSLPSVSAIGDVVGISLCGAASWTITQAAGQSIRLGTSVTTTGTGGSLASTHAGDGVVLACISPNTAWVVIPGGVQGNITVI